MFLGSEQVFAQSTAGQFPVCLSDSTTNRCRLKICHAGILCLGFIVCFCLPVSTFVSDFVRFLFLWLDDGESANCLRDCRRRDSPSMRTQTAAPRTESITTNLRMSESHRDECSVLWKTRRVGLTSGSAEGPRLLPSDRG